MPDDMKRKYSKEELDGLLKAFDVYLKSPEELDNKEILKEMDSDFENKHNILFEDSVLQAQKDIQDFVDGTLELSPDALESMLKYVETFGKEFQNTTYDYTPVARQALEKISELKRQKEIDALADNIEIVNDDVAPENYADDIEIVEDKLPEVEDKLPGIEENTQTLQPQQSLSEKGRIRSDHNLSNEQKMAAVSLQAMHKMDVISSEDFNQYFSDIQSKDLKKSQEAIAFVDETESKIKNKQRYKNTVVDLLLDESLFEMMTPELTAVAYENLHKRIQDAEEEISEENLAVLDRKMQRVLEQMDNLQSDFKNKRGYYLLDITNAADAYDGYAHMFDVRQKDLEEQNEFWGKNAKYWQAHKQELDEQKYQEIMDKDESLIAANKALQDEYSHSEQDLNEIISTYDERWNIPSAKHPKNTAIKFNDRIKKGSKILSQIKFDEETLGSDILTQISQFKFNDNQGKPLPQFIDPQNPDISSDVWRKGLIVNPKGELAAVLKLAGNDILMENLGSDDDMTQENMLSQLKDNITFKLFEMYNSEEIIRGAVENPEKFTTKKDQYLAEFEAKLNNPEIPLSISPEGYRAALDDQVNKVEVYTNRLSKKLGKNNAEFTNSVLFEQIQKIDKQAPNRGRKSKDIKKGSLKRAIWGVAIGGTMAYVGSRLVTNAVASGGISVIGSSALALGTAVTVGAASTALQIWSRKRAAKAQGEKYGWKEFKKDKMLWSSIGTTTLACAAAAFAFANAPELSIPAASCAIGSFGLGTGLRFAQPYRDMRLKGHNKLAAFALGAANAGAVFAGAYLGRQHGLNDITPNMHQTKVHASEVVGKVKTYDEDLISNVTERNHSNSMWEYRGEGPHDIPAYRNPDNYANEAWWTKEQHDNAIAALKEQMPKLGWKEGVGNEEVMLRKLASFERLHRNADFVLPDGHTVGEKFGDYKALLDGLLQGKLSPEGAKQLDAIQYNVGENGHSKILDSLGSELYSYQDHAHGIKTEEVLKDSVSTIASQDEVKAPAGGVFGWVVSSWNKFKNKIRPGTKADKVAKTEKTSANDAFSDKANFVPNNASLKKEMFNEETKNKDIQQKTVPQTKIDAEVKKYLVDEYKIVHGIAPDEKETERYFGLVAKEQENDADAPKDMLEYLVSRHKNFEKTIENVSFGHRKEYDQDLREIDERKSVNKNINAEEAKRKLYINKTRQTMWQSNLGNDGASDMTLLDFEKIMTFEVSNGGDRSLITQSQDHKKAPNRKGKQATKNPLNLKEKIRNENRDI